MDLNKFLKNVKNLGVVLVAIAGAVASLEKLSQLNLNADDLDRSENSEK